MTRNQIAYWELQESKRSNRARETETHRTNLAQETETNRANLARETETNRSNLARERQAAIDSARSYDLGLQNLRETIRNNTANQKLRSQELAEQKRHSVVGEAQNAIQLGINSYDATTRRLGHLETQRSNMARESQNFLNYRENQLQNLRQYQLGKLSYFENKRSNLANEQLRRDQNQETFRHNIRNESISQFSNLTQRMNALETKRHNSATEAETKRSNQMREIISSVDVGSKMASGLLSTLAKVM